MVGQSKLLFLAPVTIPVHVVIGTLFHLILIVNIIFLLSPVTLVVLGMMMVHVHPVKPPGSF